jgi:hypothetical protein
MAYETVAELYPEIVKTVQGLCLQEDRAYTCGEIAAALQSRIAKIKDLETAQLSHRIGLILSTKYRFPDFPMERSRRDGTRSGGSYMYRYKTVESAA